MRCPWATVLARELSRPVVFAPDMRIACIMVVQEKAMAAKFKNKEVVVVVVVLGGQVVTWTYVHNDCTL